MPRRIIKPDVALRSYPPETEVVAPPEALLKTPAFSITPDANRAFRQRFGRSISLDRIEAALMQAYRGSMRSITDLAHETVDTDPHLASVLNKRFGALASLPWTVAPATGTGVNDEKARFYAAVVREQLENLEAFSCSLNQLAWALFDGRAALELLWTAVPPGAGMSSNFGTVTMAVRSTGWIHPRRLSFDQMRDIRVVDEKFQDIGGNFSNVGMRLVDIPYKFVTWTPQLYNEYPEREGLAQRVMYWSFFKRFSARERMVLTELYGKPWRILKVDEESTAGADELRDADQIVDQLGGSFTARLPRGVDLDVVQPQRTAGAVHREVIKDSDDQISKLVLGQTGTTDGVPAGLNSNQANVMQDEQLMILQRDAGMLSEIIESQLTDQIIALNFGDSEVTHAPRFKLRSDLPADRNSELQRLQAALEAGLQIPIEEAYAISGFSMPEDTDTVIQIEQPPTPATSPVAPAPRPTIVYPQGASPAVG